MTLPSYPPGDTGVYSLLAWQDDKGIWQVTAQRGNLSQDELKAEKQPTPRLRSSRVTLDASAGTIDLASLPEDVPPDPNECVNPETQAIMLDGETACINGIVWTCTKGNLDHNNRPCISEP